MAHRPTAKYSIGEGRQPGITHMAYEQSARGETIRDYSTWLRTVCTRGDNLGLTTWHTDPLLFIN